MSGVGGTRAKASFQQVTGKAHTKQRAKRAAPFSLRLTTEERAYLEQAAGNQPLGAYIRSVLLGDMAGKRRTLRKPKIDDQQAALLLAELGQTDQPRAIIFHEKNGRRGFVALDHRCEVFAVSKWVGIKAKDVRAKLTDQTSLPAVDEAKQQIARGMAARLKQLQDEQNATIKTRLPEAFAKQSALAQTHQAQRQALKDIQQKRWQAETLQRQQRFNQGLKGLLDRVTGQYQRLKRQQNELAAYEALQRD